MEAKVYAPEDLHVGMRVSYERLIAAEDVLAFARLSGDQNPLHIDVGYAAQSNYQKPIVHGAFQVGLASALLGMHLPGRNVLLSSINSRFPAPLYYPVNATVSGEITAWNFETRGGQVKVVVQDEARVPTAEVLMGFTLHEKSPATQQQASVNGAANTKDRIERKIVVVTGASGGLGRALVQSLAADYHVLALTNKTTLSSEIAESGNICQKQIDLNANFEAELNNHLGANSVYGLVHAAWPGAPRGSLLQANDDVIDNQVRFGTTLTVRLARFLFEHANGGGGRFVALGSTAGSFKPYLPLGVYSLGKACLENTIRLLAPELARKKITANAACPSFVPVGINQAADERRRLQETANVPMGRLCEPSDVVSMVRYFLSENAAFVSGQMIALTGAQL